MIVDSVLLNAKAYLKEQIVDCCIAIEEGKIQKIGKETNMPQSDEKTDLHNLLVLPGLIDEHVHLRDEGRAYKEDFTSGTSAAAAGGFTTVLDMPNNDPITMSVERLKNRIQLAKRRLLVNVGFYSEFPESIQEIKDIADAGAVAFKLFMGNQTGGLNVYDDTAIIDAFNEASKVERLVAVHAEDRSMLATNEAKLKQMHKSALKNSFRVHTEEVELRSVQRLLVLIERSNVKLHFVHISTAKALEAITKAKKATRRITCEVTPNHLMLTEDEVVRFGGLAIMTPPLRNRLQVNALWKGLEDRSIDTIGSDHAPHALEEKSANSVWDVKPGVPGLEVTLPLLLTMVRKNKITINQVVSLLSEKPAKIYGLSDRGRLETGLVADLTIVDYNRLFKIDASKFTTKAKFSPYNGWDVYGKSVKTIVNGTLVYDEGDIVAKGGVGAVLRGGTT